MGRLIRWIQKKVMSKKTRCPKEEHCLKLVRLMLDDEATEADSIYVAKHIDGCYRCYDNYGLENTIREAVKNKVNNKKVSSELIAEINSKVNLGKID